MTDDHGIVGIGIGIAVGIGVQPATGFGIDRW